MSALPVDVLAVMGRAERLDRDWGDHDLADDLRVASAELGYLMREADIIADALTQDGRGPAGMTKEAAAKRLRAALARVQGGAA